MALKYRFNLKDIKLEDFRLYLFSLFKAFIPKKKIKNIDDLESFHSAKVSLDISSYLIQLFKNKNGN